jgi:hypothetical protein
MKKCTKCKEEKQLTEFNKAKNQRNGLSPWCKECINQNGKDWYLKNKEKHMVYVLEYRKKWDKENKEHIKSYGKEYRQNNKDKIRQREKLYREKNNHVSRWRDILKSTLKRFHRGKTASTQTLLGYSAQELKEHLDKLGMNWDTDHIDHIIPLSWFKKSTPIHVVNDLRNLQPLFSEENLKKHNKFGDLKDISYINDVKKYIKKDKLKLCLPTI